MEAYARDVTSLLKIGDPREAESIESYQAQFGIGQEHVSDLIRMVGDEMLNRADQDSTEVWAPLHAWRALGELQAEVAIEPILEALNVASIYDDDWACEELPEILGKIGPSCIQPANAFILDDARNEWARTGAARCLEEVANNHAESRDACIASLWSALDALIKHPTAQELTIVITSVINSLVELKSTEAMGSIERAFELGLADELWRGDWECVRAEILGLPPPERPRSRSRSLPALALEQLGLLEPNPLHYRDEARRQRRRERKRRKRAARQGKKR